MCDLIIKGTYSDNVKTSSGYIHKDTLVEIDFFDTFLYSLFCFDDMYAIIDNMSFRLSESYGEKECFLWPLFPFDPCTKCGYDDVGIPNLLLGLPDKQSDILENLRLMVSLSPWGNTTKCASFLHTIVLTLHDSQLMDANLILFLKERGHKCLSALIHPCVQNVLHLLGQIAFL